MNCHGESNIIRPTEKSFREKWTANQTLTFKLRGYKCLAKLTCYQNQQHVREYKMNSLHYKVWVLYWSVHPMLPHVDRCLGWYNYSSCAYVTWTYPVL